jgi:hypothetical protein
MPLTRQQAQEPGEETIERETNRTEMAGDLNATIQELISFKKAKTTGENTDTKKTSAFKPEKLSRQENDINL